MTTIRFIIVVLLLAGCAGEKTETPVIQDEPQSVVKILRELQMNYSTTEGCYQEVADIFNNKRKNG